MLYAAIDIHKRTFHAAVLDVESGEAFECRFGATREELNDWAMPLQGRRAFAADRFVLLGVCSGRSVRVAEMGDLPGFREGTVYKR